MSIREIGSEFWDVPVCEKKHNVFPETVQWFLSGRSALQSIVSELKGCHSVAVPSWCCDSIIKPFVDAGYDIQFYSVYWMNGLIQKIDLDCDVLFLMDYFGYSVISPDLGCYKGIVIRDVTHSIFSSTYSDANYYFGSLRKWCGFWTGGFAWCSDGHKLTINNTGDSGYVALRENAMQQKAEYIEGKRTDKNYLKTFEQAENVLESVGFVSAAERDVKNARQLDVEYIREQRKKNAEVLRKSFFDWLIFPQKKENDVPMFVPILVPNGKRNELRKYLIQNKIYCPIHWPLSTYHELDDEMKVLYENELSLVCDQRYSENDMLRVVKAIKEFMEK